jgi:hypothetical protein
MRKDRGHDVTWRTVHGRKGEGQKYCKKVPSRWNMKKSLSAIEILKADIFQSMKRQDMKYPWEKNSKHGT